MPYLIFALLLVALEGVSQLNTWITPSLRAVLGMPWLQTLGGVYLWFGLLTGVFVLFEWSWSARQRQRPYWRGLQFWAVYLLFSVAAVKTVQAIKTYFDLQPLVDLSAHPGLKLVWIFVFDFFYYWFHRLQHGVPLLWRFHAVHHSIADLSAIGSYHHVSEEFWRLHLVTLPMAWLMNAPPGEIVLFTVFTRAWGTFIHSSSVAHIGPLRRVFADNHYHWVHHSKDPAHWNRNFAAFFVGWDFLFGTLHLPSDAEIKTIEFGLDEVQPPQGLGAYLSGRAPLQGRKGAAYAV